MEVKEIINNRRTELGLTMKQVADLVGVSEGTISRWESGDIANMRRDKIAALANALHISPSIIMGWEEQEDLSSVTNLSFPAARPLPILGTICAGNGVFCEENYSGYFFVDNSIKADLCLTVRGDSMTGMGIQNGDVAFIRKTDTVTNGKVYAVRINSDSEAVLKSVYIDGDKVVLNSANTDYAPIITTTDNISIIGSLVGIYHSLK